MLYILFYNEDPSDGDDDCDSGRVVQSSPSYTDKTLFGTMDGQDRGKIISGEGRSHWRGDS